jgi:catechol 2,3-dioxygenase-like lactoylglutathione lyase family enzyme
MFKETHPILGTRDIQRAIAFYTQQLGFKLAFGAAILRASSLLRSLTAERRPGSF